MPRAPRCVQSYVFIYGFVFFLRFYGLVPELISRRKTQLLLLSVLMRNLSCFLLETLEFACEDGIKVFLANFDLQNMF